MRNTLFMALVAAGLSACVGGIDTPSSNDPGSNDPGSNNPGSGNPGSGSDNPTTGLGAASKAKFDANVYPLLMTKCGGCHTEGTLQPNAPGFVAKTAATGYAIAHGYGALVGDLTPAAAPILKLIQTGHKGMSYSGTDITNITEWLAAELAAKNGGEGGDDTSPGALITKLQNQWSACMTLANFTTANMIAWGNINTNDNGNGNATCRSCHNAGEYSFIATTDANEFFTGISSMRGIMNQYFVVDSTTAPTKMMVNTTNFQAVAQAQDPHIGHRTFNLANNNGATAMTALTNFYNLTMTAVGAGNCGETKLK